ncbi:MAG: NADH-quinone oxidoreductase subunit N [Thermoguttaceae bacterium]
MNFFDLIQHASADTWASMAPFGAELALSATIVVILLAKTVAGHRADARYLMFAGSLAALALAIPWDGFAETGPAARTAIFSGMLVHDPFAVYMRVLILLFAVLFALFTWISGVPRRDESADFFVLALSATVGMCLMVSANHMLVVFLGIEMASVPSYALAGILKTRRTSSEAALKFAVFGAATAGVMLYGISLLAGALGSAHLPTMAVQLAGVLQSGETGRSLALVLGGLMILVGLAFKLSAVPFHFWAPDVFEGSSAEVGAFLSVASKAAAIGLLVRLVIGFGYIDRSARIERPSPIESVDVRSTGFSRNPGEMPPKGGTTNTAFLTAGGMTRDAGTDSLDPARTYMAGLIALLAAVTCTFGNLAAYGQTNMKRLLAYSTIAHAGYMMMPVAAAAALAGSDPQGAAAAVAGVAFYATIYLFMNLGAFAVTAFLRNATGSEEIADYAGLVRRSPGLTVCMIVILFSLVGLPPLAGFAAKFTIFASLVHPQLLWLIGLLVIGVLNTVLSLFYYLRIVKVMAFSPEPEGRPAAVIPLASPAGLYCLAVTVPLLVLFLWWGPFYWAQTAAGALFR